MTRAVRTSLIVLACAALIAGAGFYFLPASGVGGSKPQAAAEKHDDHDKDEHGANSVELSDAKVAAAGIELVKAGPAVLRESLRLNGIIQPNQEALAQVTPRFPGIVRDVRKRLGDKVGKGDVLATIESNQSLTTYDLRAAIGGTIIDRQASLGEYVSEQKPVFVIADLSSVWIDFSVYRRDFSRVRVGDTVVVDLDDGGAPIETRISYVSPLGASDTQSALARAVTAGSDRLRPGLFATGRLLLAAKPVEMAVRLDALQTHQGRTVVFVRNGDAFEARDVELGNRDGEHAEVLFGLMPGDVYAARNSFVVKAELAKGSATHAH
ncbi:divalent metal ion exporter adaptor subunit IhpB [Vineibacter terrae]|uniref:divalent metal ion exporter adaptor subunit IhpB n=1 Tax=Vineibacter terrae TaxID=2586908 RepID=UPI002E317FE4|nr:efflux RND transporter periplasmic adaptor subunit [Vineibacter terrae]HEX2890923.1 efflux RND transporter periplasmic adaptor subunit [Vineibacter terrae]